jgi:hypothetical protein
MEVSTVDFELDVNADVHVQVLRRFVDRPGANVMILFLFCWKAAVAQRKSNEK